MPSLPSHPENLAGWLFHSGSVNCTQPSVSVFVEIGVQPAPMSVLASTTTGTLVAQKMTWAGEGGSAYCQS